MLYLIRKFISADSMNCYRWEASSRPPGEKLFRILWIPMVQDRVRNDSPQPVPEPNESNPLTHVLFP
jgi:hypothetical protein